jgi:hypothetical protein
MRHRAEPSETLGGGTLTVEDHVDHVPTQGRHRAPGAPLLPRQLPPQHDRDIDPPTPARDGAIPEKARWRASRLPRLFAVVVLVTACLGTTSLAAGYAEARTFDNAVALAIGVAVIVGLWALLIASTPQLVTLTGSVLTVRDSRGVEQFDLADGLQPVDLVAEPHSPKWALLLHRADGSTRVLRRRDVAAAQLDPIVRHYRRIADRAVADRRARFDR